MAAKDTRTCRSCGLEKLVAQFTTYGTLCMTCKEQRAAASREKRKEKRRWGNLTPEQKAQRTASMVAYQRRRRAELGYPCEGNKKLTDDQVRWIRQNYEYGNGREIAAKFDIVQSQVSMLVRGLTYKDVPMEEEEE